MCSNSRRSSGACPNVPDMSGAESTARSRWGHPRGFVAAALAVAAATVVGLRVLGREQLADAVMVYLLATVIISMRFGYGPSLAAAAASVVCFNFFFIPPYHTFAVADARHFVTFAVMFVVAAVIAGLTERAREQAARAQRLAEEAHAAELRAEAEQLRSALLSSVSHDLRTPLAIVTGAASALVDANVDASAKRELSETILQEGARLDRYVRNLLDMTRLEAGGLTLRREWHAIEDVLGGALGRVERLLADRQVTTSLPEAPTLVAIDALLVEQVLVNLLENAVKHTPAGTPIQLAVRARDGEVEVVVADAGPGVPAEARERVFEKFQRATPDPGGAGLGLAICKGIVTAHGGRIWVEPRDGGGAAFHFTLPVVGDPPAIEGERVLEGEGTA